MSFINHTRLNLAAALSPSALFQGSVSPLAVCKELYRNFGYETAKQHSIAHRIYPRFSAWHNQRKGNRRSNPAKSRGLTVRDTRQLELLLAGESSTQG
ncbi:MAG: hypothetical protein WCJ10_04560 [Opitutaceae bacterium]